MKPDRHADRHADREKERECVCVWCVGGPRSEDLRLGEIGDGVVVCCSWFCSWSWSWFLGAG
jgi:hypothetical protein